MARSFNGGIEAGRKTWMAVHDSSIPHAIAVKDDQPQQRLSGPSIPLSGRPLVTRIGERHDGEIQYQALGSSPSDNLLHLAPAVTLIHVILRLIIYRVTHLPGFSRSHATPSFSRAEIRLKINSQ